LQQLPLDDFGHLLLNVPKELPALGQLLPRMADEQVQIDWTGTSGEVLLAQSTSFIRTLTAAHRQYTGSGLEGKNVLDFGCGWGRLLRLMLKYTDPAHLFGVDSWSESIAICQRDGVLGHLAVSDYVPTSLPFAGTNFDLVYAFSVFTHLSERTARRCLTTIRARMTPASLLVITIRPVEYWTFHSGWDKGYGPAQLIEAHHRTGYAFFPHNRPPIDGDVTYGDTSISLEYIAEQWTDWEVVGFDHNRGDYYQIPVLLKPR
jgi:SAM-dependent methyltransferase